MNRKQLQEWLEQFPEDTVINVVVVASNSHAYGGSTIDLEVFTGDGHQYHYFDHTFYDKLHKSRDLCDEPHLTLGEY